MGEEQKPWHPPGEGWIEWRGGENPVPGALVDALLRDEREDRRYWPATDRSEIYGPWDHSGRGDDIVAYRVVTPAPSTIDRALFDEMVEALEQCRETLAMLTEPKEIRSTTVTHAWGQAVEAERKARAVLSKVREASK